MMSDQKASMLSFEALERRWDKYEYVNVAGGYVKE
jgi:hypothetical protein